MSAPLTPETIVFNRYRIVRMAGQEAFGLTYLAQDQQRFNELCILQEFVPSLSVPTVLEILRQRFHQEAARLYDLQHPQVPHFHIMVAHGDRLYLARNYVLGSSYATLLSERQAAGKVFSQAEVLRMVMPTLPALTYLHQLGIIHQNLSLASLVLRGQDHLPVLVDFGIVRQLVVRLQLHPVPLDRVIPPPGYAAPEQESGRVVPGTDLYGLAAIAVALLTRQEPQEFYNRWTGTLDWETHAIVQPEFAAVLRRMLHPNPQKRLGSAAQAFRELAAIAPLILQSEKALSAALSSQPIPHHLRSAPSSAPAMESAQPRPLTRSTPSAEQPRRSTPAPTPASAQRPQTGVDFRASAILVMSIALLVSVIALRALSWVQKEPVPSVSPATAAANSTQSDLAARPAPPMPTRDAPAKPTPSNSPIVLSQQISLDALRERRRQLGINFQFMLDLTDEVFYAKHPELQGQKLGEENQTELRTAWTAIANELLGKLEPLSANTRGKLGSYQRADYDRWLKPGNGASLNERELNVLVNNRFGQLFPEQKGKTLNPKTFGQVWYAIANEELTTLKPSQ